MRFREAVEGVVWRLGGLELGVRGSGLMRFREEVEGVVCRFAALRLGVRGSVLISTCWLVACLALRLGVWAMLRDRSG